MSFNRDWWVTTLPLLIQGHAGYVVVHLQTYTGDDYVVRDVVNTEDGTITLNVCVAADNDSRLTAATSDLHDSNDAALSYESVTQSHRAPPLKLTEHPHYLLPAHQPGTSSQRPPLPPTSFQPIPHQSTR